MIVVVDTNVVVAGLLQPFGACGEIVRMISAGELKLCFDARILSEYDEVLRRPKFQFEEHAVVALLELIVHEGRPVAAPPLATGLPDPDDEPFLAVTLSGGAACLITGNVKDFPAKSRQGAKVVSPRRFIEAYKTEARP